MMGWLQSGCDAPDANSRSHLLAVSAKEGGAWLNAFPVASLGLRKDDNTITEGGSWSET